MMRCPECGGRTGVIDCRATVTSIRRRRECKSCGARFTTYEAQAEALKLSEIARDFQADLKKTMQLLEKRIDGFGEHEQDLKAADYRDQREAQGYGT